MKSKKLLSLLLAAVMVCALFVSCSGETEPVSETSRAAETGSSAAVEQSAESPVSEEESLSPEEFYNVYFGSDYEGSTFTIFSSDNDTDPPSDIVYNPEPKNGETLPDAINNALLERQNTLRTRLGVELLEVYYCDPQRRWSNALNKVRTAIESGSQEFQAINIALYDCGTLSLEDGLYNLYEVPGLEVSNPWWDQTFNESVEMFGKLFFTNGDIAFRTKNAVTCIIYNRSLCERLGVEDPVKLTLEHKWTIDKCIEISGSLYEDTLDDGVDYLDRIGWAGQYDDMALMMYGAGVRILGADSQGRPSLTFYNEKTEAVVNKVLGFMVDAQHYVSGNDLWYKTPWPTEPMLALFDGFIHGRHIFYAAIVEYIFKLSEMEDNYAIVPAPLYDEEQEHYYSLLNSFGANAIAIAQNVDPQSLQFVGRVLDTLGYLSWSHYPDSLAFNYYDVVLKNQKLTDEESEKMIDIIFNSAGCETGAIYQVGKINGSGKSVYDLLVDLMSAKRTEGLAAVYDANKQRLQDSLDDIIAIFESNTSGG